LTVILPLILFLILVLLYLNTKSLTKTFIVLLGRAGGIQEEVFQEARVRKEGDPLGSGLH
jgi:hypothetical protein